MTVEASQKGCGRAQESTGEREAMHGVARSQDNEALHVRNICKSWTKEALKKKLTEYGIDNIEEITLMEDPQQEGTNRGFAFLEFPTHLEATKCLHPLAEARCFLWY
jgi:RNA recognition motif-containing protein